MTNQMLHRSVRSLLLSEFGGTASCPLAELLPGPAPLADLPAVSPHAGRVARLQSFVQWNMGKRKPRQICYRSASATVQTVPGLFSSLRAHLTCRVQRASSKYKNSCEKICSSGSGPRTPSPRSRTRRNVARSDAWRSSPPMQVGHNSELCAGACTGKVLGLGQQRSVQALALHQMGNSAQRHPTWGRGGGGGGRGGRNFMLSLRCLGSAHADSFSAPAAGRPAMAPTDEKGSGATLPRFQAGHVKHNPCHNASGTLNDWSVVFGSTASS